MDAYSHTHICPHYDRLMLLSADIVAFHASCCVSATSPVAIPKHSSRCIGSPSHAISHMCICSLAKYAAKNNRQSYITMHIIHAYDTHHACGTYTPASPAPPDQTQVARVLAVVLDGVPADGFAVPAQAREDGVAVSLHGDHVTLST